MRSLIILEVEHDESTDSIQEFIECVSKSDEYRSECQWLEEFGFEFKVTDATVKVDIPDCFRLDK